MAHSARRKAKTEEMTRAKTQRAPSPEKAVRNIYRRDTEYAANLFCLSGDDDKQKHSSIGDTSQIKIRKNLLNRRFSQIDTDKEN